jgi:hypothetical protein
MAARIRMPLKVVAVKSIDIMRQRYELSMQSYK